MSDFFREPDPQEKNKVEDGQKVIFLEGTKDSEHLTKTQILDKFHKRNRRIVLESKNILNVIKELSCPSCFNSEHSLKLIGDDFESNFKTFKGRLVLKEVFYRKFRFQNQYVEESFTLRFKTCDYCGTHYKISLDFEDLNEEQIKILKAESRKVEE